MIVLDTDAVSHIQKADPVGLLIEAQLAACSDRDTRIASCTVYEVVSGAVALIERCRRARKDTIYAYRLLQDGVEYFARWRGFILPYDREAEKIFHDFPARLRQTLKEDARIAAIALANHAAVWTCNVADFSRVPGLTVYRAETGLKIS